MRFAPTVREMGTIEQTCTHGMPARSISLTSVAPQRVHVPQVDVKITAWTSAAFSRDAISAPNSRARRTDVALPTVV